MTTSLLRQLIAQACSASQRRDYVAAVRIGYQIKAELDKIDRALALDKVLA